MNNEALGSEYHKLDAHKMDAELSVDPTPDFGAVARRVRRQGTPREDGRRRARRRRGVGREAGADDPGRANIPQRSAFVQSPGPLRQG